VEKTHIKQVTISLQQSNYQLYVQKHK